MKYQLLRWNIRNMGLLGFLKSRIRKPIEVQVVFKRRESHAEAEPIQDGRKVMLIKANGLAQERLIRRVLNQKKIDIEEEIDIADYNELMWQIFRKVSDRELSAWETINCTYFADNEGRVRGKAYIFSKAVNMDLLEKTKRQLRRKIGVLVYQVTETMENGTKERFCTSITPLHVPDRKRMEREYSLIYQYGRLHNG